MKGDSAQPGGENLAANRKVIKIRTLVSAFGLTLAAVFASFSILPFLLQDGHPLRKAWFVFGCWMIVAPFHKADALQRFFIKIKRRQLELACLGCWLFVVLVNAIIGRGYTSDLHLLNTINMILVVIVAMFYSAQLDGSFNTLIAIVITAIGVESFRSLSALVAEPGIARQIMQPDITPEMSAAAGLAGIGQYGYYTGLAIVLPVFFARAFMAGFWMKLFLLFMVLGIVLAILLSTFMGSILLMLVGLVLFAAFYVGFAKAKITTGAKYFTLAGVALALCVSLLKDMPQFSYVSEKFLNQVSGVANEGFRKGDQTDRWDLWEMSFRTFTENPIIGIGPVTSRENPDLSRIVGGHASWLDQFAEYGTLGFGFYVLFFLAIILRLSTGLVRQVRQKKSSVASYAQLISGGLFIIGGIYNPITFILEIYTLFYFISINELGNPITASVLRRFKTGNRPAVSLQSSLMDVAPIRKYN